MKSLQNAPTRRGAARRTCRLAGLAGALLGAAACSDAREPLVGPRAPAAAAAAAATAYTTVVGEDWTRYASLDQLRAAGLFYWQGTGDVFDHVALVPDATFGQVVRIRFPQNSGGIGQAPRMGRSLPQPMDRMWFRWRMKWTPGWTTVGPDPAGAGNSYKMVFWTWQGYNGRANVLLANTDDYVGEWFVADQQGRKIGFAETLLPGSARNFGEVGTEWQDSEWYEYVAYYETTSATGGRQHWWRRKLTEGGQVVNNPWLYYGMGFSGNTMPRVDGVQLGVNKNKNNPTDMYLSWGPWEVVDGNRHPNPWSMPNVAGGTPTPPPSGATLTRVTLSPDTATVTAGGTLQFQASGRMSDGTTQPVSVTYTATGGSVTASGAYTAPGSAGMYRVVATQQGGTLADTSTVTVSAPPPPPPPPPPAGGPYATLAGDDWRSGQLQGFSDAGHVSLAQDPTFGQVVRITQPGGSLASPRLTRALPATDRVWLRWRMRYSPGWANGGTYGLGGLGWAGHAGNNWLGFFSRSYNVSFSVRNPSTGGAVRFTETQLPGSQRLGAASSEWTDGQWYEYVAYYEKTGATTARQHYWRRRLTSGGQVAPGPWTYHGFSLSGAAAPQVGSVLVGLSRTRAGSATQHVFLGPWEAVDGSRHANPFGMPNV